VPSTPVRPEVPRVESLSTDALDRPTVAAIAVVAYALANLIHEGLGHGGACVLVGGRPAMLNAVFFRCDVSGLSGSALRLVAAGGSVTNLIAAGAIWTLGRYMRPSAAVNYFLWLLFAVNVLTAFGYLLFSGIGGFGDWAAVIDGLPGTVALRIAETALGAWLYFVVAPRMLWPGLVPFLGSDPTARERRARTLTLLPYIVGGTTYIAAGILNPVGFRLVLVSAAAASFGGTSLLAWYFALRAQRPGPSAASQLALGIPRSAAWLTLAGVTLAAFVGVLGRGVLF
jgi:hypothetical protein